MSIEQELETLYEEPVRTYEIQVEEHKFQLASNDGEAHIKQVEKKLVAIFSEINRTAGSQSYGNRAMKAALLLADEIVRVEMNSNSQIKNRVHKLLKNLEMVLDP